MTLHLPVGYVENLSPTYFVDDADDIVFQPDVYVWAMQLGERLSAVGMLDIGCGRAEKLALVHDRHPEWTFTGVDIDGPNLDYCRAAHPWMALGAANLERGAGHLVLPFYARVVVCSDVIEHLVNPRPLLRLLRDALDAGAAAVVLSTPDRVLTRGPEHLGPPLNPSHVREWSLTELVALLEASGLAPATVMHTRSADNSPVAATIYVEVLP